MPHFPAAVNRQATPESTIKNMCVRTAYLLILGPSKLRTCEAPARITGTVMQYAPLNPPVCCPNAELIADWGTLRCANIEMS